MKKVLLTNHFIRNYTGSELAIYDLAQEFIEMDYHVSIGTFHYDYPVKSLFEKLDIEILDLNTPLNLAFDLIWAHHFTTLDACLLDNNITADKIIFSSLSPYEPIESPPVFIDKLTVILANSEENRDKLLSMRIPEKMIKVFPNPVRREFFVKRRSDRSLSLDHLAIISNHIPDKLQHAIRYLKEKGIRVDVYGMNNKFTYITPDILSQYDAVVSIGRTVQYCLAMGIPVYCYDHFGGPGYIVDNNKIPAAKYNFSGRCTKTKKSAETIAHELVALYQNVLSDQKALQTYAFQQFDLSSHLKNILSVQNPPLEPLASEMFYEIFYRQHKYLKTISRQNNELINSVSWKITKPIRVFSRLFKKISS